MDGPGTPDAIEWRVDWVPETGSTNADLAARGAAAPEGSVLVADFQSQGRGRLDRTWTAPAGSGLLVSVLLRPRLEPDRMHLVVVACALAAADMAETLVGVRPPLKWPNDLLGPRADGSMAKLGGILAELSPPSADAAPDAPPTLVVGMGLNVTRPDDLPEDLAANAIYLDELAAVGAVGSLDRRVVLEAWLNRLGHWYGQCATPAGRGRLIEQWKADLITLGLSVRAIQRDGDIVGQAVDVAADGSIIIETSTGERTAVQAGDVVHLR